MKRFGTTWMSILTSAAVAACVLWSCNKPSVEAPDNGNGDGKPEPVVLEDQILYDNEKTDIKSVIYKDNDGQYTFWFSPADGITTVSGAEDAGGALVISLTDPSGTVELENGLAELTYSDIHLLPDSAGDVEAFSLSLDLSASDKVKLSLDLTMKSGETLLAEYDNVCAEAEEPLQPLENQYELDGEIFSIGSAVAWYSVSANTTEWTFYTDSGVTEPSEDAAIKITVAGAPASMKADLSDTEAVSLVCGSYSNTATTIGSLEITVGDGTVAVSFDATNENGRLRADYDGSFTSDNDFAGSWFTVTESEVKTVDVALGTVYRNNSGNVTFLFGDAASPAAAEDLVSGKYAVSVSVPSMYVTEQGYELDINSIEINIHDYTLYTTSGNDDLESCAFTVRKVSENSVYFSLSSTDNSGRVFAAEWLGGVTEIDEIPDLVPVEPEVYAVTITPKAGGEVTRTPISGVQIRRENGYKHRGGDSSFGGAIFDAYVLYFCTELTKDNPDDIVFTPALLIPVELVDGKEHTFATEDNPWELKYQNYLLYSTSYSNDAVTAYGTTYYCPDDAKVTISKDPETREWKIDFSMTDYISSKSYGQGTGNMLDISWKGPLSEYTGSKVDDMTEAEY